MYIYIMENIIISGDGIFVREFNENLKIVELVPISEELSYYYRDVVELSDDLTFGGLFAQLEPYLDKFESHFLAETRKWPLQPFFDAIKGDVKEDLNFTEIQFSWTYDYYEYSNRKTGEVEKSLDEYIHVGALGQVDENGVGNYSISFVELNNIKNVPVKIIKDCSISKKYEKSPILEFEKEMNLRDLIGALFHEITFYGSPERTKEQLEILSEKCDIGEESGMIPWENIQLEWLEEELEEALEVENYEWAQRVRIEIEKLKVKE
jgi:hypothetical protein